MRVSRKHPDHHYNPEYRVLYRELDNKKHLLWIPPFSGTTAFNADVYNSLKNQINWLGYKLDGKRYICRAQEFELYKEEVNEGLQYALDAFFWTEA